MRKTFLSNMKRRMVSLRQMSFLYIDDPAVCLHDCITSTGSTTVMMFVSKLMNVNAGVGV